MQRAETDFDPREFRNSLENIIRELDKQRKLTPEKLVCQLKRFPKDKGKFFSKSEVIAGLRAWGEKLGLKWPVEELVESIQMKPARTLSGVTPVTVLTKPFPCSGKCIFCPSDVRMPKSYLASEPGAQRARRNFFHPYLQTYNRLLAYREIGHPTDKVELIILGGTWSDYPKAYQIWFVKECFRAMNDFGKGSDDRVRIKRNIKQLPEVDEEIDGEKLTETYNQVVSRVYRTVDEVRREMRRETTKWQDLVQEQKQNEKAKCRCVGLVAETRPDNVDRKEVVRMRRLGVTKVQIGYQSLNDRVLKLNHRGHSVAATRRAMRLLRQAGFKIHAHWMPNLYGSSVGRDKKDFELMFNDGDFRPDELKIYPCSLIASAELMSYYQKKLWRPYTYQELLQILVHCLTVTPEYCRITRIVRDISSDDIWVGNKLTNFRQIAEAELKRLGKKSQDIRSREIRENKVNFEDLSLEVLPYSTTVGREVFLQYVTYNRRIAGFLRLSLPKKQSFIKELANRAIIREVHVYGQAVGLGRKVQGRAQHGGLGTKLIEKARQLAKEAGFRELAVIAAVGTREYYRQRGFVDGELYLHLSC